MSENGQIRRRPAPIILAMDFLLDPDHCYPALLARDARFDGQWFVGVTSTGVYCRPICRVRTPRRENCRFFPSATLAEAARFRPCLKCRPELAPAARPWSTMDAAEVLAREAARWLDECAPEEASLPALAARLGVSERHVRRVFTAVHGVAPLQYLQTRRLLLAKQLLTDTRLPIAEVALAAGFSSLRRFNAAFQEHYRLSPTALRKGGAEAEGARPERAAEASTASRSHGQIVRRSMRSACTPCAASASHACSHASNCLLQLTIVTSRPSRTVRALPRGTACAVSTSPSLPHSVLCSM